MKNDPNWNQGRNDYHDGELERSVLVDLLIPRDVDDFIARLCAVGIIGIVLAIVLEWI